MVKQSADSSRSPRDRIAGAFSPTDGVLPTKGAQGASARAKDAAATIYTTDPDQPELVKIVKITQQEMRRALERTKAIGGWIIAPDDDQPGNVIKSVAVWAMEPFKKPKPTEPPKGWKGEWRIMMEGRPTAQIGRDGSPIGTWAELVFGPAGNIIDEIHHYPAGNKSDRMFLDRAVKALLDELVTGGGRRIGSGLFSDAQDCRRTLVKAIRALYRLRGRSPTQREVADWLTDNVIPQRFSGNPERLSDAKCNDRQIREWIEPRGFNIGTWDSLLAYALKDLRI